MLSTLTAIVLDGEVGALVGQTESEGSWLIIFICRFQNSYQLRKDK